MSNFHILIMKFMHNREVVVRIFYLQQLINVFPLTLIFQCLHYEPHVAFHFNWCRVDMPISYLKFKSNLQISSNFYHTVLQAGRSQIRFPMRSLGFQLTYSF
jgi:hypothetical protein